MPKKYFRRRSSDTSMPTMEAALRSMEEYPNSLPKTEVERFLGSGSGVSSETRLYNARTIIKRRPELVPEILAGTLSVFRAYELVTKGTRTTCSACGGKGFTFQ